MKPPWADSLQWVAWFAPWLLVIACTVRRPRDPNAVLLACAFFGSFVVDTLAWFYAGLGVNTWWLGYAFYPVQFALLAAIVVEDRAIRHLTVLGILALGTVSALRGTADAPETFVRVIGGLAVAWLAGHHIVRYRPAVQLYAAGAAPLVLLMATVPPTHPVWPMVWASYQVVRIAALCWLGWAILGAPPFGLEVHDGFRDDPRAAGRRHPAGRYRPPAGRTALHRHSLRNGAPVQAAERPAAERGIA